MRLVVALTGASSIELGIKFIKYLPKDIELFCIYSKNALEVAKFENRNFSFFLDNDLSAPIASGSFRVDAVAIIPCSINTLAKIAVGICDTLPTRVAQVAIKEKRKLLLAVREMPLSSIVLENMLKLSNLGVIISPPILGYYSEPISLEEMERFIIGKWYDSLGIEHNLFKRWGE